MLKVRTEVKPSPIHGLGLFATAPIKEGQEVWVYRSAIDSEYSKSFVATLPDCVANQFLNYSYVNPNYTDSMIICGDDARFMNFPPLEEDGAKRAPANLALGELFNGEYKLVAARDIEPGEELTVPFESDADAARKLGSSF